MQYEFLWKDADSGGGGCASVGRVPGGFVVNGIPVDEDTSAQIPHRNAGEVAVFVPTNVLDRLRDLA